jgi:hypothetical protein
MRFLFSPKSEHALPQIWQDYRILVIVGVFVLLLLFYKKVFLNYLRFSNILQGCEVLDVRPQTPLIQAAYYFQQDKVRCLLAWIMELCEQGGLTLHYVKGAFPWALGFDGTAKISSIDRERIKALFVKGNSVMLKAWMKAPNSELQSLAYDLYDEVKKKGKGQRSSIKGSWLAWMILIALIVEIPFFSASLEGEHVALLPVVVFATLLTAIPAYVFSYTYSLLFTESRVMGYFMMAVSFMFPLIGIAVMFSADRFSGLYLPAALFPGLALCCVILVIKQPVLPQDESVLAQIFGYRKYLAREGYRIGEEDLPWTISLGVHSDMIANEFSYAEQDFPFWLKTVDPDVPAVIKLLHQTLQRGLNEAVNGEMKTNDLISSNHSSSMGH